MQQHTAMNAGAHWTAGPPDARNMSGTIPGQVWSACMGVCCAALTVVWLLVVFSVDFLFVVRCVDVLYSMLATGKLIETK
jgi:hypothetical protein